MYLPLKMGLRNGPSNIKSADFLFHFGNYFDKVARYDITNIPSETSRDVNKVCFKKMQLLKCQDSN